MTEQPAGFAPGEQCKCGAFEGSWHAPGAPDCRFEAQPAAPDIVAEPCPHDPPHLYSLNAEADVDVCAARSLIRQQDTEIEQLRAEVEELKEIATRLNAYTEAAEAERDRYREALETVRHMAKQGGPTAEIVVGDILSTAAAALAEKGE